MKPQIIKPLIILHMLLFMLVACEEEWLDIKRDKKQVIPTTLDDFQALLDNTNLINRRKTPALGEVGADDYYISTQAWESIGDIPAAQQQKQAYIWGDNLYTAGDQVYEWVYPYRKVFYANVVLEGLDKINPDDTNRDRWNNIQGCALFYRAWSFFQVAQLFCRPYDSVTAASDLGIPIRLDSDITIQSARASVQQTYHRILQDIQEATSLLPYLPAEKTRPSKASAYAFLARVYLQMGRYSEGEEAATNALEIYNSLLDYNTLDSTATYPFQMFNEEVLFHCSMIYTDGPLLNSRLEVDTILYQSYYSNDLRKKLYYFNNNGLKTFRGSYVGGPQLFSGLTTSEIYLIRAECKARQSKEAMPDLNTLLEKRYVSDTYQPPTPTTSQQLLDIILKERRKELVFRGMRWSDLRRLNKEPQYAKTLYRTLGKNTYVLPPNDNKYVLPLPPNVLKLANLKDNPR